MTTTHKIVDDPVIIVDEDYAAKARPVAGKLILSWMALGLMVQGIGGPKAILSYLTGSGIGFFAGVAGVVAHGNTVKRK